MSGFCARRVAVICGAANAGIKEARAQVAAISETTAIDVLAIQGQRLRFSAFSMYGAASGVLQFFSVARMFCAFIAAPIGLPTSASDSWRWSRSLA
jgi:hypothetical protein